MLIINVNDYRPLAEKAVLAITRNVFPGFFSKDDIDDLVSTVVTRMWEKRDQYDESRGTVSAWVNAIARNAVLDAHKQEIRRRSLFSSTPLGEQVDDDGDVVGFDPASSDETDARAIARDTERALRESASTGRNARLLNALIQGSDASEMAAAEHVSTAAIYTAVCHLRKRLRSGI